MKPISEPLDFALRRSEMIDALERLRQANKDNQRMVTVNAGVLKAALREIKAQSALNGEGLMTRAIIHALEEAIK